MLDINSIIALIVGSIGAFVLFRYWFAGAASGSVPPIKATTAAAAAADTVLAQAYKPFPLIERTVVNHNTRVFRFGLPKATDVLNLPLGQHISLKAKTAYSDKVEYRSYTPISDNDDVGYFDLLVKVYEKGVMTRHLDNLKVGDTIDVRGPKGNYTYVPGHHTALLMLAGGTGIAPMFQIIKAIAKNPADTTKVHLVYANVTEEDILLRHELEEYSQDPRISVTFSLDKPTDTWPHERGFISAEMIERANAPTPSVNNVLALVCGPPLMCKAMESNLSKLGFTEAQRFIF